jgi:hypothetical protein
MIDFLLAYLVGAGFTYGLVVATIDPRHRRLEGDIKVTVFWPLFLIGVVIVFTIFYIRSWRGR